MIQPQRIDGTQLESVGSSAVVTPHLLASQTGQAVLRQGGNAVDAVIAANATQGVVAPETCGIGGDLFALIHVPGTDEPITLNSSGRAKAGASAERLRKAGATEIPITSPDAITVPGCVDGWLALSDRFGRLPLATVLAPAVALATEGFAATPELAGSLQRLVDDLAPQPAARGLYPDGPPAVGDTVSRPALAETLADIGHHGRDAFYTGRVADAICRATNHILTPDDLAQRQAEWIEPIGVGVMGWKGWTIPPNSQGYLTLAAAWLFEQLDPPHDPSSPQFTHAAIEAFRAVAWERDDVVADPAFAPLPLEELLSPSRLEERLGRIAMNARTEWPAQQPAGGGTAYLCTRDADGMGVSLIQSNYHGIGSRIGAGDTGFFLHDRGSNFSLEPGHPNELAPGKRPLHTLSPTIWTSGGDLKMILGTRGGDFQPQTLLQLITYIRWAGLTPAAAQLMPRWTTDEWRKPGKTVSVEPHLGDAVVNELRSIGHEIEPTDGWMGGWGPVSIIDGSGDEVRGAADPRVASSSAVTG